MSVKADAMSWASVASQTTVTARKFRYSSVDFREISSSQMLPPSSLGNSANVAVSDATTRTSSWGKA